MASFPRIFCLLPISAIKKFIYIFLFCNFFAEIFFFLAHKKDRKKKGAHSPLPREKNLYLFSSFFTYTSKYQNVTLFFDWMSHNESCVVSGQSALKRLKNRVKK